MAVRSPYYSEAVEAELTEAGIDPGAFRKGQRLYELYCMNCHKAPNNANEPEPSQRLAPPAFAVADHYRKGFPDTLERIAAIKNFTANPSVEDALMPGAVRRFGLMARMPLPEDQLEAVSIFLGTAEFVEPAWYQGHYVEEHGN